MIDRMFLVNFVFASIGLLIVTFGSTRYTDRKNKVLADSVKTCLKQIDSLKLQSEIQWKYIQSMDKTVQYDHDWLNAFKIEYPWIDKRIKEDKELVK